MAYINGGVRRLYELGHEQEKACSNTAEQSRGEMSTLYGHTQSRSRYTGYLERGFVDGKITETVKRWALSAPPDSALAA